MPRYFDADNLTENQQANWQSAIDQYHAIREQECQKLIAQGAHPEIAAMWFCSPETPRNAEKSALFARLLEGKPPLPHPPPRNMNYPWYEVIEHPGPHPVIIDQWTVVGGTLTQVAIGQHPWEVVAENAAARAIRQGEITEDLDKQGARIDIRTGPWEGFALVIDRQVITCRKEALAQLERTGYFGLPVEPRALRTTRADPEQRQAARATRERLNQSYGLVYTQNSHEDLAECEINTWAIVSPKETP